MALLGDDGRGYELARMLESHGVWREWLGDSLYPNFIHFLSSPSSWDAFMRADYGSSGASTDFSRTRAQLQLQLRARALLFDKASVSLYLRSSTLSSNSISKLNPNYLQLHGDDVYFTLEEAAQRRDNDGAGAGVSRASSKSKSSFGVGSRYTESDALLHKFKFDELPATWYAQFFETYKTSKSYRISFGDQETERRTQEQMFTYLKVAEQHKRKRAAFREEQGIVLSSSTLHNGANMLSTSFVDDNHSSDEDVLFFPETMFSMNSVPDGAVMHKTRAQYCEKVDFNGILDNLPQVVTKSPMIERLGIRPEHIGFDQGGNQCPGRNGSEVGGKFIGQEQASVLSHKVIARYLCRLGFEGSSEVPLQVLGQLLSSHICKLGRMLRLLADSFKRRCSAMELLKMFLHTAGYSNLGALAELVKNTTRSTVQQTQQIAQGGQSQVQVPVRQTQQFPRQMLPQIQQLMRNAQNLTPQQQQLLWDKMRKHQQLVSRSGMVIDKDRPLMQVKVENPSDFPVDNNFNTVNSSHPQMQHYRQQQQASMSLHAPNSNQFRPVSSIPIPQSPSPSMGMVRTRPMKVEGFQDLIGGDASLKHNSEENKLTSPSK